jgi:hypothetical protein
MKTHLEVEEQIRRVFPDSAQDGGELSASRLCRFTPEENALSTYLVEGRMGPTFCLDAEKWRKIPCIAGYRTRFPLPAIP